MQVGPDGRPILNARQRRTLRRAQERAMKGLEEAGRVLLQVGWLVSCYIGYSVGLLASSLVCFSLETPCPDNSRALFLNRGMA